MKAVAQGLINNVDQDVVHHAKLALDSVRFVCNMICDKAQTN